MTLDKKTAKRLAYHQAAELVRAIADAKSPFLSVEDKKALSKACHKLSKKLLKKSGRKAYPKTEKDLYVEHGVLKGLDA